MGESMQVQVKKAKKKEREGKDKKSREITIKRENPFSLFQGMDRFFDNFSRSFLDDWYWPFTGRTYRPLRLEIDESIPTFRTPLANVSQDEKNYTINAELPGVDKGEIELSIQDGILEIKSEHKEEKKEEKGENLIRRECFSSSYFRSFKLPETIDESKIDATLDNGLLKITIPKLEPIKPEKKKIEIQ